MSVNCRFSLEKNLVNCFSRLAKEKTELEKIHSMTEEERRNYMRLNPKIVTNKVSYFIISFNFCSTLIDLK